MTPKEAPRRRDAVDADQISFVLCVEANRLEPQALMLCESIRRFGGRYANASVVAISPRPDLALGPDARARLRHLDVAYVVEPLNLTGHPYGTINRIVSGAWAEAHLTTSHLVVLDTDMVLIAEPAFEGFDVGVRPVDTKGSASSGDADPLNDYWSRVCAFAGVDLDALPMLHATMSGERIRASYNGGFAVIRRALGILQHTREVFLWSLSNGERPWAGQGRDVRASTGLVGAESSEWWGSSQCALSAAIWSKTKDVHLYGPDYNIPLHLFAKGDRQRRLPPGCAPILLHYHYLAEPEYRSALRGVLELIDCPAPAVDWMFSRLPLFDRSPVDR